MNSKQQTANSNQQSAALPPTVRCAVCCSLFAVYCVAVCCLLFAVCCLLFAVSRLGAGIKAVTDPGLSQDVFRVGRIRFQLFAQLADEDSEIFGLFSVVTAPDGAEQFVVSEHRAGMLNHKKE